MFTVPIFDDAISGDALANRLVGGEGHDVLNGEGGNDTFIGEEGDDVLSGGLGRDLFIYNSADFGNDTIVDFLAGSMVVDRISLREQGVASFSDVMALMSDTDTGAVLSLANGTITFSGVSAAQFAANDFLFA